MKVLMINTRETRGGAAQVTWQLSEELRARGHDVSLAVRSKDKDQSKTLVFPGKPEIWRKSSRISKLFLGKDIPSAVWNAWRKKRENDVEGFGSEWLLTTKEYLEADLVHIHNLHGNFFDLKLLNQIATEKPLIWTLHDMWPITANCTHSSSREADEDGFFACQEMDLPRISLRKRQKLKTIKQKVYQDTQMTLVSPSRWLANLVSKSVLSDKKLLVIPNGVNLDLFKPGKSKALLKRKLGIDEKVFLAMFVADMRSPNYIKGADIVEEVIKYGEKVENLQFLIVGRNRKENSNGRVVTMKYMDDSKDLSELYGAADVLLMTSRAENCPLVVLEAMASGTPVMGFGVGGVPELIKHNETGWVVQNVSAKDMWHQLLQLISKREMLVRVGKDARESVLAQYDLQDMVSEYERLYQEVLSR